MAINNKSNETFEKFKVQGEDLLKEVKKWIHEGNVRKILIKDEKGVKTYIEIPVTFGVIGALFAPVLAAVGALAAMVGFVTVEIVRDGEVSKSSVAKKPVAKKKAPAKKAVKVAKKK